jgi:hypothetical protein
MPGLRFAIGAVLAIALLIVAIFGVAATVQVAHHRSTTSDDQWRTLAFPDRTDRGLLTDRPRPTTVVEIEVPEVPRASVAITAPPPEAAAAVRPTERAVPQEAEAAAGAGPLAFDTPPATIAATPPPAAIESPVAAPEQEPAPVDVVAAIPDTTADPIQPAGVPPAMKGQADDKERLEPSERVGVLPAAGHGVVPPEHPVALPVPLPPSKPAVKKPHRKKVARIRLRWFFARPPLANTRYLYGPDKFSPDSKTSYDKKWTTVE